MLLLLQLDIRMSLLPIGRSVLLLVIVLLLVLVVQGSGTTFTSFVFVNCYGNLGAISMLTIRIAYGSRLLFFILVLVLLRLLNLLLQAYSLLVTCSLLLHPDNLQFLLFDGCLLHFDLLLLFKQGLPL